MLMVDENMIKAMDDGAERLMQNKQRWASFLADTVRAGCSLANTIDEPTREAFKTFHDLPKYMVKDRVIDAGPKMVFTGVTDPDGAVSKKCSKISLVRPHPTPPRTPCTST